MLGADEVIDVEAKFAVDGVDGDPFFGDHLCAEVEAFGPIGEGGAVKSDGHVIDVEHIAGFELDGVCVQKRDIGWCRGWCRFVGPAIPPARTIAVPAAARVGIA